MSESLLGFDLSILKIEAQRAPVLKGWLPDQSQT